MSNSGTLDLPRTSGYHHVQDEPRTRPANLLHIQAQQGFRDRWRRDMPGSHDRETESVLADPYLVAMIAESEQAFTEGDFITEETVLQRIAQLRSAK